MDIIPGAVIVDATPRSQPQPVPAIPDLTPPLDDAAVRQAIVNAEASNQDPLTLTTQDLGTPPQAAPTIEVPQKFLKPDGTVDVEKIQASTKQLDEAIQKKDEAIKSVDDYMREYTERENKFRNMPNPDRLVANLPPVPPTPAPIPQGQFTQQQLEEIVRRDYQQDPLSTTTRLIELALEQRFKPIEQREKIDSVRSNIQGLAEKDPRVLRADIFAAINQKIATDPDIASRKNPHKAAWLEVKEEMRLGDPIPGQAQPSKPSLVLGGGTPPSAPSASVPGQQITLANLDKLDIRKKDQEALGDAAVRAALMGRG